MVKDDLGYTAKQRLIDFVGMIDSRLETFWDKEIARSFGFNSGQKELVKVILEHAKEHNLRTGKRLRGSFVYYAYLLGNMRVDESIWRACEAVEIVHTALLMHDDFMDQDDLRRGKPTTHNYFSKGDGHYGDVMAVNVGDSVLCLGFERLIESGFDASLVNKSMSQLLRGITNTAFGQAYDVSLPKKRDLTSESVLALHTAKTAIYTYENPLFIGGILGGLSSGVLKILHEYSMSGGVAFQLQDDILGVFGNEEDTGKSNNSDILQGKVTLLITKALEVGSDDQKKEILKVWGNKTSKNEDIEKAKNAIKECGSYDYSVNTAKSMAMEAASWAGKLRSFDLNKEAIDYLEGIAMYMVERKV